jgi:hypothetical protein
VLRGVVQKIGLKFEKRIIGIAHSFLFGMEIPVNVCWEKTELLYSILCVDSPRLQVKTTLLEVVRQLRKGSERPRNSLSEAVRALHQEVNCDLL